MFKKILLRSLAGATAVGSALALSVAAGPATVGAAPEIRTVACTNPYQASVATSTAVSVRPSIGAYGTAAKATAKVTSSAGTPTGSVRFTLYNPNGSVRNVWTKSLNSAGVAGVGLPRALAARHTYRVRGAYLPGCSVFQRSGDDANYTVVKAATSTVVKAPNVRRGTRARVNVYVDSKVFTPGGKVRIMVLRKNHVLASTTRTLSSGHAFARFGKYRVGSYTAKAIYLGTGNFYRSRGTDGFRVYR
jgi:hypothetical protein